MMNSIAIRHHVMLVCLILAVEELLFGGEGRVGEVGSLVVRCFMVEEVLRNSQQQTNGRRDASICKPT